MKLKKYDFLHKRYERRQNRYIDRRSGEDRRQVYSLDYFEEDNIERRQSIERRINKERRTDCVRADEWSSVCPDKDENLDGPVYIGPSDLP